ncbi:hypothetical protein H0H87_002027 [Tephrocybe sp. NHM501043]|nr:hypothetical protein H0H87_002027 [Tephrocybe sp. NHM501043]
MQKLNSLLHKTPLHFKPAALCEQLEAKMDAPLCQKYIKKKLQEVLDFNKGLDTIHIKDDARHLTEKCQWEIADEARIDQYKATHARTSKPASKSLLSSTIAAINTSSLSASPSWEATTTGAAQSVAAVYCLDDDDEPDDVEVSLAPLSFPHLHWDCTVTGPGVPKPIAISSLLDNGSHLVLIEESLVKCLCLCHFRLHESFEVSVALDNDLNCITCLSEYCKLSVSSADNSCGVLVHYVLLLHVGFALS